MQLQNIWRDTRFLQLLAQVLFIIILAAAAAFLYANVTTNLARQGLAVGYGFLDNAANFDIGETSIPYQPSNTYARAFLVGLTNTLLVSFWGIILATILGVLTGVARLSSNWLLRQIASAYVGVIRNTPLILQLMFWYFGIILQLPNVRNALSIPGPVYLSNRGLYLPVPRATPAFSGFWPFILAALIALLAISFVFRRRAQQSEAQGLVYTPSPWRWVLYVAVPAIILLAGFILQPLPPFIIHVPELAGLNFRGGLHLTPEFAALLFGLVVYTAAFIGEVVRAGIQAVPRGQWEAARSLGLHPGAILRLVVFPQALRIIIPPTTSQYLNLAKNSSLAIAIGFPDLFSIAATIFNQTGAAIEVIAIIMISYLAMSLVTSLLMNIYNARTRIPER